MCEVAQDVRETQVVFNRQDHAIRALAVGAVVRDGLRRGVGRVRRPPRQRFNRGRRRRHEMRRRVALHDGGARGRVLGIDLLRLAHMPDHIEFRGNRTLANGQRQRDGKHAALARLARHTHRAAQQTREFPRYRQSQTTAAVLAAGRAIGLLERLENEVLLVARNADARVAHIEAHRIAAVACLMHGDRHLTVLGELERVRQQVAQHLLEALVIGDEIFRHAFGAFHRELQALRVGDRREGLPQRLQHPVDGNRRELHIHLPRFHLRQIQDVVDERQQIAVRRMNGRGVTHLFFGEIAVLVVLQELGENQRAIQRRAQFVRHVRKEFGLVLARPFQRQRVRFQLLLRTHQLHFLPFEMLRIFLEMHIRLLEFGLLRLQPCLRFHQHPAAFLELFIGYPQLLLLDLQFLALAPRFLQQLDHPRAILRRAQRHAHGLSCVFEQLAGIGKRVVIADKTYLQHAGHFAVGHHRCNHAVARRRRRQRRPDRQEIRSRALDLDRPLLIEHLSEQPLAPRDPLRHGVLSGQCPRRDPLQGIAFTAVQHSHFCPHIRHERTKDAVADRSGVEIAAHLQADLDFALLQPCAALQVQPRFDIEMPHAGQHEYYDHADHAVELQHERSGERVAVGEDIARERQHRGRAGGDERRVGPVDPHAQRDRQHVEHPDGDTQRREPVDREHGQEQHCDREVKPYGPVSTVYEHWLMDIVEILSGGLMGLLKQHRTIARAASPCHIWVSGRLRRFGRRATVTFARQKRGKND